MDILIFGLVVGGLFMGIYIRWRRDKMRIDWEIVRVK